jgi:hypothetical protein
MLGMAWALVAGIFVEDSQMVYIHGSNVTL